MKTVRPVITGLGCICAAGGSLDQSMASLYAGSRNHSSPVGIQTDLGKISPVFEVPGCADGSHQYTSRTTYLAITAAREACNHANLAQSALEIKKVGVAIGTTVGCTLNNEPFYRAYKEKKTPGIQPVKDYLHNNPALYLADLFRCSGPAVTIANACSSGTDAIGTAKSWIENNICDIVIAGGADELCRTTYLGFTSLLITSPEPCRPFDRNRSGLNLGEGAGIVIVENARSARDRGAAVLASVSGYGTSGDAYHPTAPHPGGAGLRRAMSAALHNADIPPDRVAFINAHGTSTLDNDRVEGRVIQGLFPQSTPVVSTKSYTGHTLGAAGGIEAAFTIQALLDGKVPATAGFEEPDPECGITPTTENTAINGNIAVSNSLAFGGNNSVLVFETDRRE